MTNNNKIQDARATYSRKRLTELRDHLARTLLDIEDLPALTVFGAGSFARLEASEYSDIDMFFLSGGKSDDVAEPKTSTHRLFGKVIEIVRDLKFPKLSNDCEYLVLLHTDDMLRNLGSRTDDHENYFTARMLLLLESHCLYGDEVFERITREIVRSYFVDYPDHRQTFQAMFLLNDICRFWKTLLLNYENKRKLRTEGADIKQRKTKQKVRNFKLKFSRMTTCFATIAALGSHRAPVTEEDVVALTKLTPRQRLDLIGDRVPAAKPAVNEVLGKYGWFLEMTGKPTSELEAHFFDKQKRTEMFQEASEYGDSMFKLIENIDQTNPKLRLLRNLVI